MKILLLGANGQVGWQLQRSLSTLGELISCDRQNANLADLAQLISLVRVSRPDIIVNAAAYTSVDKAESEPEIARLINTEATGILAGEAKKLNALLVHYSTNYVFDGMKTQPYTENDSPDPQSVYGATKLDGETAIINSGCRHLIFRTSWVYSSRGHNFIRSVLQLAQQQSELRIVADQTGAPTGAALIADTTSLCLHSINTHNIRDDNYSGLYHLTARGKTSWYEFSRFIISKAVEHGIPLLSGTDTIQAICTEEYPLPATRPASSVLSCEKLETRFKLQMPDWQQGANHALKEIFLQLNDSNS